jgi:uncharacterized protein YegP (UPF0339 family)
MRNINSLITALVLSFSTVAAVGCAEVGSDDDFSEEDGEATSAGKLSFWKAGDGFHFNLKSGNGAILLTSEAYTSRTGAINGALSVLENGVDPAMYTVNQTATGWNLHLKAANHETIAFSQVYSTKSNATRAVTSSVKAVTTYLDKRESNTTGARVEFHRGETGQYRFNVHAKNGQIVLSSEQYTTEAAAVNGAVAVQTVGKDASAYSLQQNASKGWYFTVSADNGQIVGVSQQYTTKAAAQSAITSLKSFLPDVSIL